MAGDMLWKEFLEGLNDFTEDIFANGREQDVEERKMPEIGRFYGIVIKMFFKPKEHEPSHIHALYGENVGVFDLHTLEMTEGDLPRKAQELVKEWMQQHQKELQEMWASQNLYKLPPL